jgi:hypothetical protein
MLGQGLTDIDTLTLAVRDPESRRLVAEAITAYRGGALRSAIMSTWIAVAFDIIAKVRELAAQGEAAPRAFIQTLDSAIANGDIRKMQAIESDLLTIANEQLQMLAPHEHEALTRIQADRNLCAHPAFVVEDELYQPTLELVRSHIVHALQYLLIHAPLQGKSAIARFDSDVVSSSFPTDSEGIGAYMRAKYLDRAKDVLVVNLIKALLSAPFGEERAKYAGRVHLLAMTLKEIAKAKTAIYDGTVPGYVGQKFDFVSDDVLLNICAFLEGDPRIWVWLSEPVRLRIKQLLQTADVEMLKAHAAFDAFAIAELAELLAARFDAFEEDVQIGVIAENPRREFVSSAISIYRSAGGWRHAEMLGRALVVRLAHLLTADDIKTMLDAVMENCQIWSASGTPTILETVFDLSRPVINQARPHWQHFVDTMTERQHGNPAAYYAYPGIREKLNAA